MPADQVILHQRAHGVDHLEAVFGRQRARTGKGGIPAHRIAGDGDNLDVLQGGEIGEGGGVDQRRGVVAARVFGDGIGGGAVQRSQGFLAKFGAAGVESGQQRAVLEMPRKGAKFGLAVSAATGADDHGGSHFSNASAAATISSADGMVAA